MAMSSVSLLLACVSSVAGFTTTSSLPARPLHRSAPIQMMEQIPRPDAGGFPYRSAVLGLVAIQSAFGLAGDREIGGLLLELSGQKALANDIDYFGTIVDSAFLAYGSSVLLKPHNLMAHDLAEVE